MVRGPYGSLADTPFFRRTLNPLFSQETREGLRQDRNVQLPWTLGEVVDLLILYRDGLE